VRQVTRFPLHSVVVSPKPTLPPELHKLETEVMEDVWSRDDAVAVREVMEPLNKRAA
jgi:hypothetical protein